MERSNDREEATTADSRRRKLTREQLIAVGCILVTELFERLTFYSIVANLVLLCTSALNYSSDDASAVVLVFTGTVYLFPMLGGFVADAWLGKFRTIVGSCMIYIYGFILLLGVAWDRLKLDWHAEDDQISLIGRKMYLFSGLTFIAVGVGGFKANIGPYGAQQVEDLGPGAVKSFFYWYFWFTNAGAVIALSGVAYVQQEMGFGYGFLIPFISIILALVVFVAAKSKYVRKHIAQRGNILRSSMGICMQSCSECRRPTLNRLRRDTERDFDNQAVVRVHAVLPVFGLLIVFGTIYSQMNTSFFLQSARMDIVTKDAKLPAASMGILPGLVSLILIPVVDRGIDPLLAKLGRSVTHLQRIGIGTFLAACAMFYAGVIEIIRKNDISQHGYIEQTLFQNKFNASKISIFAQVPEFVLMGFSGILASVTGDRGLGNLFMAVVNHVAQSPATSAQGDMIYHSREQVSKSPATLPSSPQSDLGQEFAYKQAPWFIQGLGMGLFWMTVGLGNYLALIIAVIVKLWRKDDSSDWFPKEPNNGHMEYFMFLLATLAILGLIVTIVIARWYGSEKVEVLNSEEPEPEVVSAVEHDNRACERTGCERDAESTL